MVCHFDAGSVHHWVAASKSGVFKHSSVIAETADGISAVDLELEARSYSVESSAWSM